MCSSKKSSFTDERTTTEILIVNYDSHLPWELARACTGTIDDTLVSLIQRYIDFSGISCITD
jgi:hypothetical protein